MSNHNRKMKTLLAGIAAAATVLTCGPSASADPDQTNDQTTDQTEQKPGQDDAAGIADKTAEGASKGVEGAQKGVEGAEKATEGLQKAAEGLQQGGNQPKVDLSDKDCWVVNGVPQMGILPQPPNAYSIPCYYVYGLTPH